MAQLKKLEEAVRLLRSVMESPTSTEDAAGPSSDLTEQGTKAVTIVSIMVGQ